MTSEPRYAPEAYHFTVAVFVVEQGHVLLHLHRRTGLWLPPGGHIEPGELPDEAALRETMEEAGLAVRLLGRPGIDHHADDAPRQLVRPEGVQLEDISPEHQHIDLIYFAVPSPRPGPGTLPEPGGEGGMRWVDEAELARLPVTEEVATWVRLALAEVPRRLQDPHPESGLPGRAGEPGEPGEPGTVLPPSPTGDPTEVMARVCRQRSAAWALLDGLTDPADPAAWVADLPARLEELVPAVGWLQEDWRPDGLLLLEGLVRRARRRGEEGVVELARDGAVAAGATVGRLHRAVAEVTALCATELGHWERGAAEEAKSLRVQQMTLLVPDGDLRRLAGELAGARLPVWSPVAQVVAAYLLLETGR